MKGCPSETKGEPHRRMKRIHYEVRGNPIENIGVPTRNQVGTQQRNEGDSFGSKGGPIEK